MNSTTPTVGGRVKRPYSRWLWAAAVAPVVPALLTGRLAPEPHGHWLEHLTGAALKAAQLALLLLLLTLLGGSRRRAMILVPLAVTLTGIALQVAGDYQVAQSIWATTANPGFGVGYEEGHDLAGMGDLLVLVGGLTFVAMAGMMRVVPVWMAVLAAVTTIIPPPFFWPAVGTVLVLMFSLTSTSTLTSGSRKDGPVEAEPERL